jgi:hypothetical protein
MCSVGMAVYTVGDMGDRLGWGWVVVWLLVVRDR